jgi:hypothetical protein
MATTLSCHDRDEGSIPSSSAKFSKRLTKGVSMIEDIISVRDG